MLFIVMHEAARPQVLESKQPRIHQPAGIHVHLRMKTVHIASLKSLCAEHGKCLQQRYCTEYFVIVAHEKKPTICLPMIAIRFQLEEQMPTTSQEGQNSRRISRKVCGSFAEAPRKGGPVFAGKWPRSMGSPMEPKPIQAAEEHYLT